MVIDASMGLTEQLENIEYFSFIVQYNNCKIYERSVSFFYDLVLIMNVSDVFHFVHVANLP